MEPHVLSLAGDVWKRVGSYLDMLDLLSLWLIGSKVLTARLGSQGGWNVISLPKDEYLTLWQRWPSWLISRLHGLNRIQLCPTEVKATSHLLKPSLHQLSELPKSLVELKLGFVEGFSDSFCAALPRGLIRLLLPYNTLISDAGLANLPKSILELDLRRNRRISCGGLPRDLATFVGHLTHIKPCEETFRDLPRSLTSLKLTANIPPSEGTARFEQPEFIPTWHYWNLAGFKDFYLTSLKLSHLAQFALPKTNTAREALLGLLDDSSASSLASSSSATLSSATQVERYAWNRCRTDVYLPESLTSLKVGGVAGIEWFDPDCIPFLPRHLETLVLRRQFAPRHYSWRHASEPLTVAKWNEHHLWSLPRSLTHLHVDIACATDQELYHFTIGRTLASRLPTELTLDALSALPPDLKVAILPDFLGPATIPAVPLNHPNPPPPPPPSSLLANLANPTPFTPLTPAMLHPGASIHTQRALPQLGRAIPAAPPPDPQSYFNSCMTLLPQSIQHLKVRMLYNSRTWMPTIHANLPPGIKSFNSHYHTNDLPATLPPHLLGFTDGNIDHPIPYPLLMCGRPDAIDIGILPPNLRYFSSSNCHALSVAKLPRSLTVLSLNCAKYPLFDQDILTLPDGLTVLQLQSARLTDECIPALPHDLTKLDLTYSDLIKGDRFPFPRKITSLNLGIGAISPILPPFVTKLHLASEQIQVLPTSLPSSLTELRLFSFRLPGECVKDLPNTLLKLYASGLDLEDEDVCQLPRRLLIFESFSGGARLSDRSAGDWPPILQALTCASTLMTTAALPLLPRTLRTLCLIKAVLVEPLGSRRLMGPNFQGGTVGTSGMA